jgi:heme/copper-type cytochrome/quinol oxidase subunit 1
VFPVFAAYYYWLPKMTGRLLDERLGKWSFWVMFVGFNLTFFPMHLAGLLGMPRRIYTYPASVGWGQLNLLETIGTWIMAAGILLSIVSFVRSLRSGVPAGRNPWNADGLEWDTESPPPVYGSERIPVVATRHPLWDEFDEHEDPADDRTLDHARTSVMTTVLDARPLAVATMPEDTATPLYLALSLTALFTALLLQAMWIALGAACLVALVAATWLWPETGRHLA